MSSRIGFEFGLAKFHVRHYVSFIALTESEFKEDSEIFFI